MRTTRACLSLGATVLLGAAMLAVTPAAVSAHEGTHPTTEQAAQEFQQVELAKTTNEIGEPMAIAVLKDRSVLHTSRHGTLYRTDEDGATTPLGTVDVYTNDEDGMQGIGVDPDFDSNRFVFIYYAPKLSTPAGEAPYTGTGFSAWQGVNRLSRFRLNADYSLDKASEKVVLDVAADRGICCHAGGDIDFDAAGNLYLSTGDDTNPFQSDNYTPIDERANRNPAFDAQRTSANTNDLRGKVLRIKVNADGSYSIPSGNLFAPGTAKTRPEIYAMGFRNPFRMSVDKQTGVVYLGEYGPDAGSASNTRGPGGKVEFNRITGPGNFGWPYCVGDNSTANSYVDYDFATTTSGQRFNCANPVNNSPRNTGLTSLPPAQPAWITYDGCSVPEFGCGGESPMGGPVYRYDADLDSDVKFPATYDGHFFAGELGRQWIRDISVDADGSPGTISAFPWSGTQVMDMAFGPEGALYVLDYGTSYGGNENSGLYRIEHVGDGQYAPKAVAKADRTSGQGPLTVAFSSAGSSDANNDTLTYSWDFGDGTSSTDANPTHTYPSNGQYTVKLTVKDTTNRTGNADLKITVGNTAPTVTVTLPANGALADFGETVPFSITVTDPEDGTVDCSKVKVNFALGHDLHGHTLKTADGTCSGSIDTPVDGEHDANANIFGVWRAEYTDNGANGQPALTTVNEARTQPRTRQAEHFSSSSGVKKYYKTTARGGQTVGDISDNDWIAFEPYVLSEATTFRARVSSAGNGGTLELRAGAPDGTLIGSASVPATGAWDKFTDVGGTVSNAPAGTTTLYLVFKGAGALFDLDEFQLRTTAPYKVLVFTRTAGFAHDSIPAATAAITQIGQANGFTVDATADASAFTAANLAQYKAVVFLSTTGDVLDAAQQSAFENYIKAGGGYAGIHAAADTEYDWPFYGGLVGAYFANHPDQQQATVKIEDNNHTSTAHLGTEWSRFDEWYSYTSNPRSKVKVLATLDESSYTGGTMGPDHPIVWCQEYQGGRSWYTGLGHTAASYDEVDFRAHLAGGIRYAAGDTRDSCTATQPPPSSGGVVQGESFTSATGELRAEPHADAVGGRTVGYIRNDDSATYANLNRDGATGIRIRASSGGAGGTVEVRSGSATGTLLGSATVPATGGWNTFQNFSAAFAAPASGTGDLTLVFKGGSGYLFDVDEFALTRDVVQAETFATATGGLKAAPHADATGGQTLGYISNGDSATYQGLTLDRATGVLVRASSGGAGGTVQIRAGSAGGTVLGSVEVPYTGSWDTFTDLATTIQAAPAGTTTLALVFSGGSGYLLDVDEVTLTRGVKQGEGFSATTGGIRAATHAGAVGGATAGYIPNGESATYRAVTATGATGITVRASSNGAGGTVQVRAGTADGKVLGSVDVAGTGSWDTFQTFSGTLAGVPAGTTTLVLLFSGGSGYLFDIDEFTLTS